MISGENHIDIGDVIIEGMPFSDEILSWCNKHPEFKRALKIIFPDRFHTLGMVRTSVPTARPQDQVIGVVAYDMLKKQFKQDFIVNVDTKNQEFVLYTKLPTKDYSKYVQSMKSFYAIYGKEGDYQGAHHFDLAYLDSMGNTELSQRGRLVIVKGRDIIASGLKPKTQEELRDTLIKIRMERAKNSK